MIPGTATVLHWLWPACYTVGHCHDAGTLTEIVSVIGRQLRCGCRNTHVAILRNSVYAKSTAVLRISGCCTFARTAAAAAEPVYSCTGVACAETLVRVLGPTMSSVVYTEVSPVSLPQEFSTFYSYGKVLSANTPPPPPRIKTPTYIPARSHRW